MKGTSRAAPTRSLRRRSGAADGGRLVLATLELAAVAHTASFGLTTMGDALAVPRFGANGAPATRGRIASVSAAA